ncbi:hypothetical protein F5B17DRAFT_305128 [Nemania serpens]|nr:hypothetical protein F5B17DRAFT_305128 [Nemania serpens]
MFLAAHFFFYFLIQQTGEGGDHVVPYFLYTTTNIVSSKKTQSTCCSRPEELVSGLRHSQHVAIRSFRSRCIREWTSLGRGEQPGYVSLSHKTMLRYLAPLNSRRPLLVISVTGEEVECLVKPQNSSAHACPPSRDVTTWHL